MTYAAPIISGGAFNCPHCAAFAHQEWPKPIYLRLEQNTNKQVAFPFKISKCVQCGEYAHWVKDKLVYPNLVTAPLPNADTPESVKADFEEARQIANTSPRGAAALLRLCIQKLCLHLGESGKDINTDIGNLVKKGLRVQIQQALDVVRVIGNETVHPGQLDLKDDVQTANSLFKLVNMIVEVMISEPKHINEMFSSLPQSKLEGIAKRDATKP